MVLESLSTGIAENISNTIVSKNVTRETTREKISKGIEDLKDAVSNLI